jgi:hypothetical protein
MSWSSGSLIFRDLINALNDAEVDDSVRSQIYEAMIQTFEDYDCDTLDECLGKDKIFDEVYKELNPEYFEDDEDYFEDEDT